MGNGVGFTRRRLLTWTGAAGVLGATALATGCFAGWDGEGQVFDNVAGAVSVGSGFTARLIATAGEAMASNGYEFPIFPDGAATFADPATPGGWYLVTNHEVPGDGGASSIRFAPDGTVLGGRRILRGTSLNCAGGPTPWGTWLSCEEFEGGHVWECDPTGTENAKKRPAMGVFYHEAAAVAQDDRVYLTEDRPDGGFYRFTPTVAGDLSVGLLEIATGTAPGPVTWVKLPHPNGGPPPTRAQVRGTMAFDGGEGIDAFGKDVWFATKGDDRIWHYAIASGEVSLRYQAGRPAELSGVDNLWLDEASGVLLVAEDGDDMQVIGLRPDDTLEPLAQIVGQENSEITGPCFSPDGQRLYFSSQRARVGVLGLPLGATYEVSGPFDSFLGR